MHRRSFIVGVTALAVARDALAQRDKPPRIGVMLAQPIPNAFYEAFRRGLVDLGYVEGKNILVEYRSVQGDLERYPAVAAELVKLNVEVIVAGGGAPATRAAVRATKTIPIVFPASTDPVSEGWVRSLAKPGGNATGLSILESEINPKRLQLVKELIPDARRVAVLVHPDVPFAKQQVATMKAAAARLGVDLQIARAGKPEELEPALRGVKDARAEALIVSASSLFAANRRRLVEFAGELRLPTVWEHRQFTQAGGLVSYGPDIADLYRSAARYVDKILKGAKPADLPVEQADKLELVINLRTAKAQGMTIPGWLLVRADQVIE